MIVPYSGDKYAAGSSMRLRGFGSLQVSLSGEWNRIEVPLISPRPLLGRSFEKHESTNLIVLECRIGMERGISCEIAAR